MIYILTAIIVNLAQAGYSTEPSGCLEKLVPPCSVLLHSKSEFVAGNFQIKASQDSLFQFSTQQDIYLAQGMFWVKVSSPLVLQSKFGKVEVRSIDGEVWVDVSPERMIVKSLQTQLEVQPRGHKGSIALLQGFEMQVNYVDQKAGEADYNIPMVMNLAKHLAVLPKVFPYKKLNFQDYTHHLGRVVLDATEVNSEWYKTAIQRKITSNEEQVRRLKYEAKANAERDSYLQKLFKIKSNYEDQ